MLLVLQQQMSCHIAHLITHLINLSPIVTVWDICTHTSQIGQKVFEAHTSHSQYLQKFNELGHRLLESNSVFAHIIVAFFYPATLDKFWLFLKIWWQTEPNNPARLIVRNVCAQHSHHDRYLRANTPLYTPDNQEAYLETESSVLSQKCFLGSLMAFIKHLLTLRLHWMCVRVKIHKYRSNHQCFFFTCNSCDQSQQVKFNFLLNQHRYDPMHRESEPPIFAANPSLRTIHVNHSQSLT